MESDNDKMTNVFPVVKLADGITETFKLMPALDIDKAITEGLNPEIYFIEDKGPANNVASIIEDKRLRYPYQVKLSAAMSQVIWLLSDIALRCYEYFNLHAEYDIMPPNKQEAFKFELTIDTPESRYLSEIFTLDICGYCNHSSEWIRKIMTSKLTNEEVIELNKFDMSGVVGVRTNALCVYAIVFILLHEFSHHTLGHFKREKKQ